MFTVVTNSFRQNANDVERLIDFDRDVIEVMLLSLDTLKREISSEHHLLRSRVDRTSTVIRGIRDNESLKSKYGTVCNQAVVLLVSHFGSALGDIFRRGIANALEDDKYQELLDEELKLTLRDIRERGWNLKTSVPDLLIAKRDLTFQDMQSTVRAFDNYLGVHLPKDERTHNIILGQAARHVIVHAGGRVSERMLKQVSRATPRTLRPLLSLDEQLVFTKEEVLALKAEMLAYVESVAASVQASQ